MEIGQQAIGHLKAEPGMDEKRCDRVASRNLAVTPRRRALERASGRRPDGNYSPPFVARAVHGFGRLLRHEVWLRIDSVLLHRLAPDRFERAVAHVQGDFDARHALRLESRHERLREVQPGGRSRHGAADLRVNRLIALAIGRRVRTFDVGGKRDVSERVDQLLDGAAGLRP